MSAPGDLARRTRQAQGLPERIEDPGALDILAGVLAQTRRQAETLCSANAEGPGPLTPRSIPTSTGAVSQQRKVKADATR
jgi:hypothetical protein